LEVEVGQIPMIAGWLATETHVVQYGGWSV